MAWTQSKAVSPTARVHCGRVGEQEYKRDDKVRIVKDGKTRALGVVDRFEVETPNLNDNDCGEANKSLVIVKPFGSVSTTLRVPITRKIPPRRRSAPRLQQLPLIVPRDRLGHVMPTGPTGTRSEIGGIVSDLDIAQNQRQEQAHLPRSLSLVWNTKTDLDPALAALAGPGAAEVTVQAGCDVRALGRVGRLQRPCASTSQER